MNKLGTLSLPWCIPPSLSQALTTGFSLEYRAFEGIGMHECWALFKSYLLRAPEQAILKCQKSNK